MAGLMDLVLERDGHDQPWGFRLQGGADVGVPLSVQRVLVGTSVDGVLRKDDIILKIGSFETKNISHQQAVDLFTKAGNQIRVSIKRVAKGYTPTGDISCIPVSGLSRTPESQLLNALPKTKMTTKEVYSSFTKNPNDPSLPLTIQTQPYRTNPLIQPSIKVKQDLMEPGSAMHLKKQADHIAAAHGPLSNAYSASTVAATHTETDIAQNFVMQQKGPTGFRKSTSSKTFSPIAGWQAKQVAGTLQSLQHSQSASSNIFSPSAPLPQPDKLTFKPVPEKTVKFATPPTVQPKMHQPMATSGGGGGKQVYNTPINLYSAENVAEIAKLNEMGLAPVTAGPITKPLNPQKPQQVLLNPLKEYNPQESATWLALQEASETEIDFEKAARYTSLKEHDPVYSEVYQAPKNPHFVPKKNPVTNNASNDLGDGTQAQMQSPPLQPSLKTKKAPPRSPVAEFLPSSMLKESIAQDVEDSAQSQQSAVMASILANSSGSMNAPHNLRDIPMYQTNAIGGRKKITQSASFNKVMMDVLGE